MSVYKSYKAQKSYSIWRGSLSYFLNYSNSLSEITELSLSRWFFFYQKSTLWFFFFEIFLLPKIKIQKSDLLLYHNYPYRGERKLKSHTSERRLSSILINYSLSLELLDIIEKSTRNFNPDLEPAQFKTGLTELQNLLHCASGSECALAALKDTLNKVRWGISHCASSCECALAALKDTVNKVRWGISHCHCASASKNVIGALKDTVNKVR
jgi:hypothetical protein